MTDPNTTVSLSGWASIALSRDITVETARNEDGERDTEATLDQIDEALIVEKLITQIEQQETDKLREQLKDDVEQPRAHIVSND